MMTARMVQGDCQFMPLLRSTEVDLVVTSPPYFPLSAEPQLYAASQPSHLAESMRDQLLKHADSFKPQYREIDRVLAPHGVLILQLKDIGFAGAFVRIVDRHASLVEHLGWRLVNRVWWRCMFEHPRVKSAQACGRFSEPEQFLVFRRSQADNLEQHGDPSKVPDVLLESPYWVTPGEGARKRMRFQSPQSVVKVLVEMYSDPGDLVVDPFAGSGESLLTAARLGRRAIGYERETSLVEDFGVVRERRRA